MTRIMRVKRKSGIIEEGDGDLDTHPSVFVPEGMMGTVVGLDDSVLGCSNLEVTWDHAFYRKGPCDGPIVWVESFLETVIDPDQLVFVSVEDPPAGGHVPERNRES